MTSPAQRSTMVPLVVVWAALIVYASLFPFAGWQWPEGAPLRRLFALPWPPWRDRFDEIANLLGYLPFGMLTCGALVRIGQGWRVAFAAAVAAACVLSLAVEVAQGLIPSRVPSLKDTSFNALGATIGAALAVVLQRGGVFDAWQRARERWFERHSSWALALLLLWPVALLYPAPVPLGLGGWWGEVGRGLRGAVAGTPVADAVAAWLDQARALQSASTAPALETAIVALGVLAPALVGHATAHQPRRRVLLALGALALALGTTTLSTALGFGPDHAFAWLTLSTVQGLSIGTLLALAVSPLPARGAALLGVLVLLALVWAVARAPADPYYADSLSEWERGRFIRFHGLAQWVAWVWPYVAMAWLMVRAVRRDEPPA